MTGLLLWIAALVTLGALLHLFEERLTTVPSRSSASARRAPPVDG